MITMLSDFGYKDAYVAVMKGVMASIAPGEITCDLTHAVPPHDILAARFNLMMAYPYFPKGTVHLAVADPGVGSARRAIALQCVDGFLVGPDNGLFSGVLQRSPALIAIALTNPRYWRTAQPSNTFHGRDIFAPVAAHLAKGVSIHELGDRIDPATLVEPVLPPFSRGNEVREDDASDASVLATGSLQYIDGFGNLISNISADAVPEGPWQVMLETLTGDRFISGIKFYDGVDAQALLALVGSHGWIEIACNQGSAAKALAATVGMRLSLRQI
ncbi:MAG: SAM-dependent chlorinase/fluorinase [Phormidesmis sp.]